MYSPFTELPVAEASRNENNFAPLDEIGLISPFSNEVSGTGHSFETLYENEDQLQLLEEEEPDVYRREAISWEDTFNGENVLFETEINYAKAREWNDKYAGELRWHSFAVEIYQLLGFQFTDPSEDELADAVGAWQSRNNMTADGMIGPGTWAGILKEIIQKTSFANVSIRTALPANEKLKKILGWEKFEDAVYKVLGFHRETPNAELFAKAIALWQPKWGFKGSMVDGRLGEKTWAAIRTYVLKEVDKEKDASKPSETAVNYPAIIKGTPGIYLHSKPDPGAKQTDVLYRQGDLVTVIAQSTIAAEKDWRKIQTKDKKTGWIQHYHLAVISLDELVTGTVKIPPGPYLVQPGDKLDDLVKKFYPDYEVQIGDDRRTIVHAFSLLNKDKDGIDYKGVSNTWWRDHVLDRDMADTRKIYQTIQLQANRLVYFPTESYIKMLKDQKLVGVRPDWKNTAITVGKSIQGFLEGIAEGFVDAGIDTVKGLWDFIKDLFTGELFKQIYDLYQEFSKYTIVEAFEKVWGVIKAIVGEKVDQIKKDFNNPNPYYKFHSIGKMVGYILFEVVVALLTMGTSVAAKFAAKFSKIQELLTASKTLRRVYNAVDPKRLKQAVAAFNHAEDLYNYVSLGTAVFKTMDAVTNIGIEGISLDLSKSSGETYLEAGDDAPVDVMTEEEDDISKVWDQDAEDIVKRILEKGDDGLAKEGIGLMDHVIRGQHNPAQNGIDLFGFSVHGGKVKVYIIEVKGGTYPWLKQTKISGRQMGELWIANALDAAWDNKELRGKLLEALKFYYPGKTFTKEAMREVMMKKAQRVMVVSKNAVPAALERLRKLVRKEFVRKLTLIEREWEEPSLSSQVFTDSESYTDDYLFENFTPKKPVLLRRLFGGKPYLIFDVPGNVSVTTSNQKQVTNSKLLLADIRTALAKWVDFNAVEQLLLSHNQLSPGNPYTIVGATSVDAVFTEAVHQFQVANYLDPNEQDGILGPSTLDTLGFITHGLRSRLGSSDFYGQKQLNRSDVKSQVPVLTNNEFTAANWFQFIMRPAWMGVKISQGVHVLLWRKLREAEDWLLKQNAYKGMTPAALGAALGFTATSRYSGARLSAAKEAMHGFGLALDIDVNGNPWIGAGWIEGTNAEKTRMIQDLRNAAGNQSLPGATVFAYLDNIAQTQGTDTRLSYNTLKQNNNEFIAYLRTNATARTFWRNSYTFDYRDPLNGFLNHHTDLVYALRHVAGLAWGAIDFGRNASGDIMHFDLRTIGVGKFICGKIGGSVPVAGHPALAGPTPSPEVNDEEYHDDEFADEHEPHEAIGEATWKDEEVESLFETEEEQGDEYSYEEEISEENLFEGLEPGESLTKLRERIDEYFEMANSEYTFEDGTTVRARSQFRYAWKGQLMTPEKAKGKIRRALTKKFGSAYAKKLQSSIHAVAYGKPKPSQVAVITQALINSGELARLAEFDPVFGALPKDQLVRAFQREFGVGIDCSCYVQLAFIYAITGTNDDPRTTRVKLGLDAKRGNENLSGLPSSRFKKLDILQAQTGDLLVMKAKPGIEDRAAHKVIIVDHIVDGTKHFFVADSSWGTDLYTPAAGGVARRILVYDSATGKWWDKHPIDGSDAHENTIGPYAGHPIKGLYRSKEKVESETELFESTEIESEQNDFERYEEYTEDETSKAAVMNRYYADWLGWGEYYDQINNLLLPFSGMQNVSLDEDAFATAAAAWQQQQGLSPADGIIGPKTWTRMKPLLNSTPPVPAVPPAGPGSAPPPVQRILDFNKWHAIKILDAINAGVVAVNTRVTFNPKTQLEQLALGKQVLNLNPNNTIVQVLPIIYHICEQAKQQNYRDIVIGSFIRQASNGACTGHCAGRCIDINFTGGSFTNAGSVQMVINIFNYLLAIPSQFRKNFGFGLPLQGNFFGNKQLTKFKSTSASNLIDPTLRQQVPQLGIVFPDNDNHLHIQVKWL